MDRFPRHNFKKYLQFSRLINTEPNYYQLGLSLKQTSHCDASAEQLSIDFTAKDAIHDKQCIECNISTTWQCQTCNAAYCRKCFDETHSGGKVMRRHIFTDLKEQEDFRKPVVQIYCHHHEHLPYIDFCNTCHIGLCVTCTKFHDRGHDIKLIKLMVSSFVALCLHDLHVA